MLETLVSSRIRRALFEHILTQPDHRFYLRGLAKELGLAISPLRRELKRLEGLGVLKASQEANILFYVVDQASPHFAELRAVLSAAPASVTKPEPLVVSTILSHAKVERIRKTLTPAIHWPMVIGGACGCAFIALILGWVVSSYRSVTTQLSATNQRLETLSSRSNTATAPSPQPRATEEHAPVQASTPPVVSASESTQTPPKAELGVGQADGMMQSSRWRLVPKGMGGFSAGASGEVY